MDGQHSGDSVRTRAASEAPGVREGGQEAGEKDGEEAQVARKLEVEAASGGGEAGTASTELHAESACLGTLLATPTRATGGHHHDDGN